MFCQGWLDPIQQFIGDWRFPMLNRPAGQQLLLVDIDEPSIAALGVWPWSRTIHAQIVDKLVALGAADIAFDVDFSSASTPEGDASFENALERADGTVMLAALQQVVSTGAGQTVVMRSRPIPRFAAHSWEASVNVWPDRDGRVRSFQRGEAFGSETVPSLATLLGSQAGEVGGGFVIDFGIDYTQIAHLSVQQLLSGTVHASLVRDRKVIVGASAVELRDIFQVPRFGFIPGAAVQAMAVESTLQNRALIPLSPRLTLVVTVLVLGGIWAVGSRLSFSASLLLCAGAAMLTEASAVMAQSVWPVVATTAPVHVGALALAIITVADEGVQRRLKLLESRRNANRLRNMLDRVIADNFAGIVIVDQNSRVRAASAAAATLLGTDVSAEASRPYAEVLPPPLARLIADAQADLHAGAVRSAITCELAVDRPGGSAILLDCVTTVSDVAPVADAARAADCEHAICLTFRDITAEREAHMRLLEMARIDALSGLVNRSVLLSAIAERCLALGDDAGGLIFFDVDRFKPINDRLGHCAGDALIQSVADRLRALASPDDVAARLGGDEFALLVGRRTQGDIEGLAAELGRTLSGSYQIGIFQLSVTISIGVAFFEGDGTTELMTGADAALHAAKAAGGACVRLYDAVLKDKTEERNRLAHDLRLALEREEFEVVFQRQVDAVTERIVGVEALVRWKHPERGYISPARFIPVAERTGLIEPIGAWVLATACREAVGWCDPIKVSVNLSAHQLARADLADLVLSVLDATGLPPARLDLELTESLLMDDDDLAKNTLARLRAAGVKISLDDFGTGYSSLAYLNTFPIDKVKIDQSFVRNLAGVPSARAVVRAVVSLARELDIRVNAEGVETSAQLHLLQQLGCDEVQGYLHGRPEPSVAIDASLAHQCTAERLPVAAA